jgi:hypothetical protein
MVDPMLMGAQAAVVDQSYLEEAVETVKVQIDGEIEEVLPMCVQEDPALNQG